MRHIYIYAQIDEWAARYLLGQMDFMRASNFAAQIAKTYF